MPEKRAWRLRVTRHELLDPRSLIEHPDNWRAHPDAQKDVMIGAIREIGFVGEVYVSELSGRILDGHMRVALAIKEGQHEIPVGWVDCADEAEEDRILASYDPIGTLAELDAERFGRVLSRSEIDDDPLRDMLRGLLPSPELPPVTASDPGDGPEGAAPVEILDVWGVVIECADEETQVELLERLTDEGYTARALMS